MSSSSTLSTTPPPTTSGIPISWTPSITYTFNLDGRLSTITCSCTITPTPNQSSTPCDSCPPYPMPYRILDSTFKNDAATLDGLLSRGGTDAYMSSILERMLPDVPVSKWNGQEARDAMFRQDLLWHTFYHWREVNPRQWKFDDDDPPEPLSLTGRSKSWVLGLMSKKEPEAPNPDYERHEHSHPMTKQEEWSKAVYEDVARRGVKVEMEDLKHDMTGVRTSFVSRADGRGDVEDELWSILF